MWQAVIVGLIVVIAAAYAAWALLPSALRLRLAQGIGAWGRHPGRAGWLARAATAVENGARARSGDCSDCGALQASSKPPTDEPER